VIGVAVRDALDSAVVAITASGSQTPRLDAEVLLAHVLGVDRAALIMDPARPVQGAAVRAYQDAVRRRAVAREPVAYITGIKPFRFLEIHVDHRVLVPRPETELLVEVAAELAPQGVRVLDVATGSGAVALALKHERPDLEVTGSDVSADAVDVARANARRLGLDVTFARADLLDGADADGLHGVVANPPYVAETERAHLPPEIRHEPPGALFAGPDGLDVVRRLVEQLGRTRVAFAAVEVGEGQAPVAAELLAGAGFAHAEARPDLAGIERVVVARR
jgi:release factor glutamine methyltransferase